MSLSELAECLTGAVTLVTLGGLWLTDRIVKRTFEDERVGDAWIEPYTLPSFTCACPACGVTPQLNREYGPRAPVVCAEGEACSGFPTPHVHVSCGYCLAKWMRATRSAKGLL